MMLQIVTDSGKFGPYTDVQTLEDRYRVDGADLPFSVVGQGVVSEWAGPLPVPPAQPVQVPSAVTMRQARLALLGAGKLAAVTAAINALPSPQKEAAQIEWEYSQEVQRHNGFVAQLGPVLGLDADALDALFVAAARL
jgi:hypothetical protein